MCVGSEEWESVPARARSERSSGQDMRGSGRQGSRQSRRVSQDVKADMSPPAVPVPGFGFMSSQARDYIENSFKVMQQLHSLCDPYITHYTQYRVITRQ